MSARLLFVAILSFVFLSEPAYADAVDDWVRGEMRRQDIPGLAIAVVRAGKVIKVQGYGMANLETDAPVMPSTKFQLASVTKQFTATASMLLVEDGRVALDAPVGRYLAGTPASWKAITIQNLLRHTSGLPDYLGMPESVQCKNAADIFTLLRQAPLEFQPGVGQMYSNSNYVLLGLVIQRVSGKTYDQFLKDRLFKRLGMDSTHRRIVKDPRLAVGYAPKRWWSFSFSKSSFLAPGLWDHGDGGLVTTAEDMGRWAAALHSGKILKKSSIDQMWSKTHLPSGTIVDYGFGLVVNDYGRGRIIGHSGLRPGAVANFTTYVDGDGQMLSVAVLFNVSNPGQPGYDIGFEIAKLVDPRWR